MTIFIFSESRASCYELNFRFVFAYHHTPEEMIKGQSRTYIKKKKKIDILFWLVFVVQTSKQCSAFQHNDTKITEITRGFDSFWLITNSQTHSVQTTSVKNCLPQCWIKIPACVCTLGFKSHIESEIWAALKSLSHPEAEVKNRFCKICKMQTATRTSKGFSFLSICWETLTANSR